MPAQQAGLQPKDRIAAIDGYPVTSWEAMTATVRRTTSGRLTLRIEREGRAMDVAIQPEVKARKDVFGHVRQTGVIGVTPSGEVRLIRSGFWQAFGLAAHEVLELTWVTLQSLWSLLTGGMSMKESLTGPIGIFFIAGDAARMGAVYLIQIIGVLSLSLGIFNFLPIPVLDGGHLFFLVCEKLRGRPLATVVQERAMQTGMAVLAALMLLVFYNDFARFGITDKIVGLFKR